MPAKLRIKGLRELRVAGGNYSLLLAKEAPGACFEGADIIRVAAQEIAPVKTGNLRDKILTAQMINLPKFKAGAMVVSNAFYGFWVELGTSKWRGKPYLRPAFDSKHQEAVNAVLERLRKVRIRERITP